MINLRPYQKEAVQKAIDYFASGRDDPQLIVLPTAWGKSILAAYAAASIPEDESLLVVQPTKELLEQNYSKYMALCGNAEPAAICSASFNKKDIGRITFATIGTIKSMGERFREAGFTKMLIDEAHLYPRKAQSMLGQFLHDSGIRQVLGITATPLKLESFGGKVGDRFDGWSKLTMLTNPSPDGNFYRGIMHVGQIQEMVQGHWWSPLFYEIVPTDPSILKFNSSGSEYTQNSIEKAYELDNVRGNIYGALNYHAERKHCLVFVPSVEEAEILASEYPNSAVISAQTPKKERENIVNSFRNGKIRVVVNVSVMAVGFDYTKIDMIILGFSTASAAKYYQIVGRGVRIDPEKKNCIIVDMGGNFKRFGRIEDIYFKKTDRWRMYGGDKLLTGLPIMSIGSVTRQDVENARQADPNRVICPFRKYANMPISRVPEGYMAWALRNIQNMRYDLKTAMIRRLEDDVRDTRGEPPILIFPEGKYAGYNITDIPKGYLSWYYWKQDWNETSDSLRRGIEYAFGGIPYRLRSKTK